jgi:hypothetical protein
MNEAEFPNWFEAVKPNFSLLPFDIELSVLQIGVYKGDCTKYILENNRVKKIVDVDTWEGSMEHPDLNFDFSTVEELYDKKFINESRVRKMKMTSDLYFVSTSISEKFDFIYIDGDHRSTQVLVDGINSFGRLKVGGILAFDDYQWPIYSGTLNNPKIGIDSWLKLFDGYFEILIQNYQLWIKKLKDV